MKEVVVRDRKIGDAYLPYFVAELGVCHEGDVELAKKIAVAAKEAGADCIKTETFQKENIVFDRSMTSSYSSQGEHFTESLWEHMKKCQLSFSEHAEIKKLSDELGLPFMSTAHDFEAVDFLVDIGAEAIKISSADIIHYPLIRYAAKTGLVLFIDTGGAQEHEILRCQKEAVEAGVKGVIYNHHPGGHPAPADKYDLRVIQRMKNLVEVPIGTADHYEGYEMVYAAVAVGANVIEKPVSMDRFKKAQEFSWSVSIGDLPEVVSKMNCVYKSLGVFRRENIKESVNRVCVVAKRDLKVGDEVCLENVIFGRPNNQGISVRDWDLVEGKRLSVARKKGQFIRWEDV